MKKYISPSINANYFRECILDYLTEVHHYPKSELTFWTFVDSLTFENGMISRECIVFKELKDYSDKHPVTKIAVLWSLYFENAEADFIREILLHLIEEKEKRQEKRSDRKNNPYAAMIDNFNGFTRQYKFRMKQNGVPDNLLEEFDSMQNEWQNAIKEKVDSYKEKSIPFDEEFYFFLFNLKIEVKRQAERISSCTGMEVAV